MDEPTAEDDAAGTDGRGSDGRSPARRLWSAFESLHAVTYFHPACREAMDGAGCRGFWMGYFAGRLAPMGPVTAATATAVCANFAPARVERAVPDAWRFVAPGAALEARHTGAVRALRDCGVSEPDGDLLDLIWVLTQRLDPAGRPLGAANAALDRPGDPLAALWQACTTLREHRGDTHVALLTTSGVDGASIGVLAAAVAGGDARMLQTSRGWTDDDWGAARERLTKDGLLDHTGAPTGHGRALHSRVESATDELARRSYDPLVGGDVADLAARLEELARPVHRAGVLPFPNPIGLPPAAGR